MQEQITDDTKITGHKKDLRQRLQKIRGSQIPHQYKALKPPVMNF